MRTGTLRLSGATIAILLIVAPSVSAGVRLDTEITPAYFTGEFGSGVDTDIYYLPLTLSISTRRQELSLTVPFLTVRTDEPVFFIVGEVIPRGPGESTTESGLGDVILKEEVYLTQSDGRRPWVIGIVRVKLATADETRGLGTGELDYGPGVSLIQPLGDRWSLILEGQYVVRGDPPGVDLENTFWGSAGVQVAVTAATSLNSYYDYRESVIEGRQAAADVSLGLSRKIGTSVRFHSTVYHGLTDTAEDFGISLGFSFKGR